MFRKYNRRGFTLLEMLSIIAIVALLVSIAVPAVNQSSARAKAATDAANLRIVLGMLNTEVINGNSTVEEIIAAAEHPISKMDSDAVLCAVYDRPGFIDVYYVNGDKYYGLKYLSTMADKGPDVADSTVGTAKPTIPGTWYEAGAGEITD